jgi:hypothetical protein
MVLERKSECIMFDRGTLRMILERKSECIMKNTWLEILTKHQ